MQSVAYKIFFLVLKAHIMLIRHKVREGRLCVCVCATEVGCLSKSKIMIYLTGPLVHPDSEAPLIQI